MATSMRPGWDLSTRAPFMHSQPRGRRLTERIMAAFDQACEQDDLEVAALLLTEFERIVARKPITPGMDRRREMQELISAHSRLWQLLRPNVAA